MKCKFVLLTRGCHFNVDSCMNNYSNPYAMMKFADFKIDIFGQNEIKFGDFGLHHFCFM